ncbi:MAG: hypothetical protein RLZZ455_53 [Candidatus Parcubacteria bacterium]|jgi:plastocyanin
MDENTSSSAPQPAGSNKNMILIGVFVVIVLGILGAVFFMNQSKTSVPATTEETAVVSPTPEGAMVEVTEETTPSSGSESAMSATEKSFTIESTSFKFNPTTITVKKGDKVTITLNNKTGMHDWVVDEFEEARTKVLSAGQSDTITFVADKAGTYEFYCSVGNHRQMGMVGKLIVQ